MFLRSQKIIQTNKTGISIGQLKLEEIVLDLLQGGFVNDPIFSEFLTIKSYQDLEKLAKSKDPLKTYQLVNRTLIFIKRAMDKEAVGVTQILNDDGTYLVLRAEIEKMSAILPDITAKKIDEFFEIAIGINCLNLVNIDISKVAPPIAIMLQGYNSSVERIVKPMIANIRHDIEQFLAGEII